MRLSFRKKYSEVGVIIISGSCCIPGMAPFDEQAKRVVEQAASEAEVITEFNQSGRMPLPAVLINGKIVSYGVPQVEDIKKALLQIMDAGKTKEDAK